MRGGRKVSNFAHTKVTIDDKEHLVNDLYVKPTDMALHIVRPSGFARSAAGHKIVYSKVNKLKGFLINRGYDKDEVQTQIDKATRLNRATLMQSI